MQAMMAVKDISEKNELREFLLGVPLAPEKRKEIIDTISKDCGMQKETTDFLKLLIDTNRMDAIEDIANAFDDKYNKLTDTQVRTVAQLMLFTRTLEKQTGRALAKQANMGVDKDDSLELDLRGSLPARCACMQQHCCKAHCPPSMRLPPACLGTGCRACVQSSHILPCLIKLQVLCVLQAAMHSATPVAATPAMHAAQQPSSPSPAGASLAAPLSRLTLGPTNPRADKPRRVQNVVLRSAARLEQDQEFEIAKQMQEMTQSKNIKIKPVVDEELIGGFIVEWGDNQVDLSIKGHLDRIETDLMTAAGAV
jgi:F0F1-type ATP synthase delta subunit